MTSGEITGLFEALELELVKSLKRNLSRHKRQEREEGGAGGVPEKWEAWQAAKLRDIARFRRENEAILGSYAPTVRQETEALLMEQYVEGGSGGFFRASDERLRALIDEMTNNEARVERAALRYMNDVYRKTILRTAAAMNAGGMTLQRATDEAVKDFLAQGINCVEYADGRLVNIAGYAEMALRTSAKRAMLLGEGKKREALGVDTVLVSQYGACSNTCLPWQGLVYIDDVFQPYHGPAGGSFGVSRNGRQYLRLSVAIQGGLFHPQCRHTITTWLEGISKLPEPMDTDEVELVSALEKKQRRMEREVRRAKREAAGLSDPEAVKQAKARVWQKQTALRQFVAEHGDVLRRDYWRERDTNVDVKAAAGYDVHGDKVVETVGRSVGAKSKNYEILHPITGDITHIVEGTHITQPKNHVMAGYGRDRKIDELDGLLDNYGGDAVKWTKEKGYGYVEDEYGEPRRVELHWYQEPSVGKVKMKIKVQPDGRVYLDED